MKNTFNHNYLIENINLVANDKMILRFIQDNLITDSELINCIDNLISSTKDCQIQTHNTMFSMGLKIILFKYLYKTLKIEFLKQWPNSIWIDIIKEV